MTGTLYNSSYKNNIEERDESTHDNKYKFRNNLDDYNNESTEETFSTHRPIRSSHSKSDKDTKWSERVEAFRKSLATYTSEGTPKDGGGRSPSMIDNVVGRNLATMNEPKQPNEEEHSRKDSKSSEHSAHDPRSNRSTPHQGKRCEQDIKLGSSGMLDMNRLEKNDIIQSDQQSITPEIKIGPTGLETIDAYMFGIQNDSNDLEENLSPDEAEHIARLSEWVVGCVEAGDTPTDVCSQILNTKECLPFPASKMIGEKIIQLLCTECTALCQEDTVEYQSVISCLEQLITHLFEGTSLTRTLAVFPKRTGFSEPVPNEQEKKYEETLIKCEKLEKECSELKIMFAKLQEDNDNLRKELTTIKGAQASEVMSIIKEKSEEETTDVSKSTKTSTNGKSSRQGSKDAAKDTEDKKEKSAINEMMRMLGKMNDELGQSSKREKDVADLMKKNLENLEKISEELRQKTPVATSIQSPSALTGSARQPELRQKATLNSTSSCSIAGTTTPYSSRTMIPTSTTVRMPERISSSTLYGTASRTPAVWLSARTYSTSVGSTNTPEPTRMTSSNIATTADKPEQQTLTRTTSLPSFAPQVQNSARTIQNPEVVQRCQSVHPTARSTSFSETIRSPRHPSVSLLGPNLTRSLTPLRIQNLFAGSIMKASRAKLQTEPIRAPETSNRSEPEFALLLGRKPTGLVETQPPSGTSTAREQLERTLQQRQTLSGHFTPLQNYSGLLNNPDAIQSSRLRSTSREEAPGYLLYPNGTSRIRSVSRPRTESSVERVILRPFLNPTNLFMPTTRITQQSKQIISTSSNSAPTVATMQLPSSPDLAQGSPMPTVVELPSTGDEPSSDPIEDDTHKSFVEDQGSVLRPRSVSRVSERYVGRFPAGSVISADRFTQSAAQRKSMPQASYATRRRIGAPLLSRSTSSIGSGSVPRRQM